MLSLMAERPRRFFASRRQPTRNRSQAFSSAIACRALGAEAGAAAGAAGTAWRDFFFIFCLRGAHVAPLVLYLMPSFSHRAMFCTILERRRRSLPSCCHLPAAFIATRETLTHVVPSPAPSLYASSTAAHSASSSVAATAGSRPESATRSGGAARVATACVSATCMLTSTRLVLGRCQRGDESGPAVLSRSSSERIEKWLFCRA